MSSDSPALNKLDIITSYMLNLFTHSLAIRTGGKISETPRSPHDMSPELKEESSDIVKKMVDAYLDPVVLPWDYEKYVMECNKHRLGDGMNRKKEEQLAKKFEAW
ncbi:hypothetical protein QCA50_011616 [Cerrena zonata]|uniref:Uncharacterized protein n=1 Tax=Cerrena zonata TaxID=2478898 RepID=A0AAW0FUF1_9APHY